MTSSTEVRTPYPMDRAAGMSTPFLMGFATSLVHRLHAEGLLDIADGHHERVAVYVANYLGTVARGGSLLSSVEAALLACDEVEEIYADLDALKAVVEDLQA